MTGIKITDFEKILEVLVKSGFSKLAEKLQTSVKLSLKEVADMSAGEVSYSALQKRVVKGCYQGEAVSLSSGVHLPLGTAITATRRQKAGPPSLSSGLSGKGDF